MFIRLSRHYARTHNQGLVETLFGTRFPLRHLMYASAIHYEPAPHPDCVFELSATRRYICKNGSWACDGYHDGGAKSAKLGDLARAVDRQLRAAIDFPAQLKDHAEPKYLVKMIDAEVADYLAYKEAHRPVVVDIDFSKLAQIRAAASVTQEALLVDEEREDAPQAEGLEAADFAEPPASAEPEPATSPAASGDDQQGARKDTFGLTEDERALVEALLAGRPAPGAKTSADLLVDAINGKLFDLVGDTVVEFGAGDAPELIEDYADDVREALGLG